MGGGGWSGGGRRPWWSRCSREGPAPFSGGGIPTASQGPEVREPEPPGAVGEGLHLPVASRDHPHVLGHFSLADTSRPQDEGCTRGALATLGPTLPGLLPALSIPSSSG